MSASSETGTLAADTLRRDQSVAKNLLFGEILEENLFP